VNTIVQWILGGGGFLGLVAFLLVPWQARKLRSESRLSDADAATRLSDSALKLLEPAQKQAQHLTEQLTAAQAKVTELETTVSRLTKDLTAARQEIDDLRKGQNPDRAPMPRARYEGE
jgi:uncharacterized protein HemX